MSKRQMELEMRIGLEEKGEIRQNAREFHSLKLRDCLLSSLIFLSEEL